MTASTPNEPAQRDEHERDPALAALYRQASDESPPLAVDERIRAAARRATGSRPALAGSPTRAWWPLAAAASIALIALGIVQLTPLEEASPVKPDVGSDAPPAALPAAPASSQPPITAKEITPLPSATKPDAARRESITPPADRTSATGALSSQREAQAPSTAKKLEAFPSAPTAASAESAAPIVPPAKGERANGSTPPPATSAPSADIARSARSGVAANEAGSEVPGETRDIERWIEVIRRLLAAGKTDEAYRELSMLRAHFGTDSARLLPPDLREWKR